MKRIGRKFAAALYCGGLLIAALVLFAVHIKEPNAGLLLTVVAAPCLGIIAAAVGLEGARDIKAAPKDGGR